VEVQVLESAGDWARVRGKNGWEGWVDGKLLEQLDPTGGSGDRRALILLAIALVVLLVLAIMGFVAS
jgi:SH3-like domain-containing protein